MAEYQFYQFQTVNRALSRGEQIEINTWSSRADVTPVSATFIYNYGSFKHDPEKCLLDYFDMMLYVANYGCRRLMFRFPAELVDFKAMKSYVWKSNDDYEHTLSVYKKEKYVVVDMAENVEEGYDFWVEGEGILPTLAQIWIDIANGNYACLYLAWAHFASYFQEGRTDMEDDGDDSDEVLMTEPRVPIGMKQPSGAVEMFMEFWGISDDLRTAAAQNSPVEQNRSATDLEQSLGNLSQEEKTTFLARFLRDEPHLRTALVKRLQEISDTPTAPASDNRRSLRALLEVETSVKEQRIEREKREAVEKRRLQLEIMKNREGAMWEAVWANALKKTGSSYEHAVNELKDLRDLADYNGTRTLFEEKIAEIRAHCSRSTAFMERLRGAKLI